MTATSPHLDGSTSTILTGSQLSGVCYTVIHVPCTSMYMGFIVLPQLHMLLSLTPLTAASLETLPGVLKHTCATASVRSYALCIAQWLNAATVCTLFDEC